MRVLSIEFEQTSDDDGAIGQQLLQLLIAENTRNQGEAKNDREIIRIKDSANNVTLGGIWTEILFDWMYIEVLYVPEALRGNGLGSQLLVQAEDSARSKGCVGIWLETFDFQAPDFYRKNGWELFATLPHYPRGSNRRFLCKRLHDLDRCSTVKSKNTQ